MTIALQETTSWTFPNHTYLLDDSKTRMIAYIRKGTNVVKTFSAAMPFSVRNRSFVKVDAAIFQMEMPSEPGVEYVQGSKGAVYSVNRTEGTCSCPGFLYRGQCKHLSK